MAGDNAVVIKRIKKGGHGGHHGGAWKVAYADFVTAMMAFFLLMWLINTTTPEQKRGIADYFAPQSIAQTVSGSGGVLGGKVMGEDGAHAGGAQSVMQKQSPPSPSSAQKALAAGATEGGANSSSNEQFECRIGAGRRIHPRRRSHPSGDPGQSRHRQSVQAGDHREDAAGPAHPAGRPGRPSHVPAGLQPNPCPMPRKLLAAVGGIVAALPNRVSISGHTSGNDAPRRQQLGIVVQPRQPGPRPAADRRPGHRTASTKWRARPGRSRCCRKTPMPAPTAGFPSC